MTTQQLYTVTRVVTTKMVVLAASEQHAIEIVARTDLGTETRSDEAQLLDEMPKGWTVNDRPFVDTKSRPKMYLTIAQHIALGHAPAYERELRHKKAQIEAFRRDMYGEDGDD